MSISVVSAVGRRSTDAACVRVTVRHIGDIGRTSGVQKSGSETELELFSRNLFDTELYQVALIKISRVVHYSLAAVSQQNPSFPTNERLLIGYLSFDMASWKFILLLE